ncbi:MAG: SUF system Fe-S cluster assembly protein [Rhodospirillales bacterium]|nr:SUF system Fe-S cluster assembly protein [Rhodospirillales bacterium]MBO6785866.1 SUF system Fe-S cluster assembly protein [Rhodospirillales bacterium]
MTGGTPSGIPGFDYSPVDPNEEFKATGGEPLEDGVPMATEEAIVAALQTVYDPEIPVNIYDLGLIYGLEIGEKGEIKIDMTLTAPGCPVAGEMPGMVVRAVEPVEGTGEIEVSLVWEPQWTPERMSEDAKLALGF